MRKQLLTLFLGALFAFGVIGLLVGEALAQSDISEQCCKVKANFVWKSGQIGDATGPGATDCKGTNGVIDKKCYIEKGETIGPTKDSLCSLPNKENEAGKAVDKWSPDQWAILCAVGTIYTITNWIFFIMMVLATLLIIIGGVMYMTAGGNPDNAAKGKNYITYAIIGLAVALVARFIPPIVQFIMGVS